MVGRRLGLLLGLVGSMANAFLLPVQTSMVARASRKIWCQAKEGNSLYDGEELVERTIYALYKPSEGDPFYDIVFFHGLQLGDFSNAWRTTWESELEGGQKICWPAEFLGEDFPRARVLSVSYDASARQGPKAGCSDLETVGQNLAAQLVGEGVGTRPVVLVGHSLGGLVLKEVCLKIDETSRSSDRFSKDSAEAFLGNVKGMVFYATPHGGSKLADLLKAAVDLLPSILVTSSPVVSYLKVFNTKNGATQCCAFNLLRSRHNWATLGFKENHKTTAGKFFHDIVVEEASAYRDMVRCIPIDQDHIQICKPKSLIAPAYKSLKIFLDQQLDAFKPTDPEGYVLGRGKELKEVCSALDDRKVVLIVGGPGEGKTSLAKEAGRKFGSPRWYYIDDLSDKTWSDKGEARWDLGRILLAKLEPEEPCPKDVDAWEKLLKKVEKTKGVPKGFIYDGMEAVMSGDSAKVFYCLVSRLAEHGVQQIITSRMCPKPVPKQYTVVRLSLLSKDHAVGILRGILRGKCPTLKVEDAEGIVDVCKSNPLILVGVGDLVVRNITVAKDIKESASWPYVMKTEFRNFLSKYFKSLSYLSEDGKKVLAIMSLWHSFTDENVPGHLREELNTLKDLSILYRDDGRYRMHVILQETGTYT